MLAVQPAAAGGLTGYQKKLPLLEQLITRMIKWEEIINDGCRAKCSELYKVEPDKGAEGPGFERLSLMHFTVIKS
jgi:hypothetical protein